MTKKILIYLMGVITYFLLFTPVFAENFYIENYDVNIQVNKAKQAHITENIDVYFNINMHGIFRDIPHNNGTITNIHVSEENTITEEVNNTHIKIGNINRFVKGNHQYTISYDYNYFDNKNEFYHNIIGTGWNTEINHVNFNITMPEEFNPSDVGLSIGKKGVKGFDGDAVFRVDGLNISGEVNRVLNPGEGVTIRLSVPKDYFIKVTNNEINALIALLCIITFISFLIWYAFGKDERAIPIVNFYPPKNMNTLETEIAYKEHASTKGLVAMLISLAQRGYIKIYDESDGFTLEKLKSYDGKDKLEEKYMEAIFSTVNSIPSNFENKKVTQYDLEYSPTFYQLCNDIVAEANKKKNDIYEKSSINWGLRIIMVLCLFGVVLITFLALGNGSFQGLNSHAVYLIYTLIALTVLICCKERTSFLIIWAIGFGGLPLIFGISVLTNIVSYYIPVVFTGIAGILICSICLYHLKKRNKKALWVFGNLLGFKKFIETAEKHRLELLVEKEPQYFYNVLPYAYIFGISAKWIKKFEEIMVLQPDWYTGEHFNSSAFNHFSNSMNSVSLPSTSNGGISSSSSGGGGFSGGGGGGGGGGGW